MRGIVLIRVQLRGTISARHSIDCGLLTKRARCDRGARHSIDCGLLTKRARCDRARVSDIDVVRIKVFRCAARARYSGARPLRGIVLIRMLLRGTISARQSINCRLRAKRALACSVVTVLVESRSACITCHGRVAAAGITVGNKTVVATKSIWILVIAK